MTPALLHIGLKRRSLDILQHHEQFASFLFQSAPENMFNEVVKSLPNYQALLIGEEVENPIQFAQKAYAFDKNISIILLNDEKKYLQIKQTLQFSPFIGPTVQCISNQGGELFAPIIANAIQRTAQRRSFARIKNPTLTDQRFSPSAFAKVKSDFTAKVLQEAPIGAVLLSPNALVYSINNYALNITGKTERDALGMPFSSLFPETLGFEVKNFVLDGYLTEPKHVLEVVKPGNKQYLELSVAPINLEAAVNYKLVLINNITETIKGQQQTLQQLEELEQLNSTLKLVNEDLDTFVYTASHDLKAPILNIEGLVSMLEQELATEKEDVKMMLHYINQSIRQFKLTIEELTEVSKIQRSSDQEYIKVDVRIVVEEVKQLLEREIKVSDARIETTFEGNSEIHFQKKNLTSIIYNLINNAIKYRSETRKLLIQVKVWNEDDICIIQVKDNGLGIPAEKRDRIFQLFQRMHSHVQGSGVGLYIVRRIIENNKGTIAVESEEGVGSVFTVSLKKQH